MIGYVAIAGVLLPSDPKPRAVHEVTAGSFRSPMPDHLMSVRFDAETIEKLRTIADIHDTNIAEEVRSAVTRYLSELRDDESFRRKAQDAAQRRQERISQLLAVD